jgi:hypothetical protein
MVAVTLQRLHDTVTKLSSKRVARTRENDVKDHPHSGFGTKKRREKVNARFKDRALWLVEITYHV